MSVAFKSIIAMIITNILAFLLLGFNSIPLVFVEDMFWIIFTVIYSVVFAIGAALRD